MTSPIIILTGVHGSGKSTLAEPYSQKTGIPYIKSRAGDIHKNHQIKVTDVIPFSKRLELQIEILHSWKEDYQKALESENGGIFERSPLDILTYLMIEVGKDLTDIEKDNVTNFYNDVIMTMHKLMSQSGTLLLYVQPISPNDLAVANRGDYKAPDGPFAKLYCDVMSGLFLNNGLGAEFIDAPLDQRYDQMCAIIESME